MRFGRRRSAIRSEKSNPSQPGNLQRASYLSEQFGIRYLCASW
ncbi:MAG: hypothetical protein KatS3mg023_0293 [Armatimonadota bacterium]|nr:MAG: hypothetical protein KatS3mg023_0293 [Armatimonadota bacterium]